MAHANGSLMGQEDADSIIFEAILLPWSHAGHTTPEMEETMNFWTSDWKPGFLQSISTADHSSSLIQSLRRGGARFWFGKLPRHQQKGKEGLISSAWLSKEGKQKHSAEHIAWVMLYKTLLMRLTTTSAWKSHFSELRKSTKTSWRKQSK